MQLLVLQKAYVKQCDKQRFFHRDDIRICHNAEGKKCRLGEGGFGVVFKALMNGVDEVAIKVVKADKPTQKEMALFHKEASFLYYCLSSALYTRMVK